MDVTHVAATVRNHADLGRTREGWFLVDTRATDCLLPRRRLEWIGLEAKGERIYSFADGSEHRISVTTADVGFMVEVVGTVIVLEDG